MVKRAKTRLPATDYVAALIHDMRNPLGAAVGNVAFVREQLSDEQGECVEALEDATDALRRIGSLADELLTVSQYEAGTLFVAAEHVRLSNIFETVARTMAREIAVRETSLSVAAGTVECTVDRALIARALESMIAWFARQATRGAVVELLAIDDGADVELIVMRVLTSPLEEIPRALYVAECIAMAHAGTLATGMRNGSTTVTLRVPKVYIAAI